MSVNLWKVYDLEGNMHELSELNAKEMVRHMKWSLDNPKAETPAVEVKEEAPKVEEAEVKEEEEVKEPVKEEAPVVEEEAPVVEAKEAEAPVAEDKPKRGRPSKK